MATKPSFNRLIVQLAILMLSASALVGAKRPEYDGSRPLLTLHGPEAQNAIGDLAKVLEPLLIDDISGKSRPIVVYVHGRGNEPRKSFGDTMFTSGFILKKLESQGVGVVGFNWPSKIRFGRLCDRPVSQATASSKDFVLLVLSLDDHRRKNPELWRGRSLVLLAHSMGSIVIAEALNDPAVAQLIGNTFNAVVLSAPDALAVDHAKWLGSLPPGMTFVLSNPSDRFLHKSMSCEGKKATLRLGLLSTEDNVHVRAPGATYIQVPAGERHRYIARGAQEANPNICETVTALLRGNKPPLQATWKIGSAYNAYSIPVARSASDPCFSGSEQPERESDRES